ncbi:MAG: VIT1/CCC1 transporter family protein [Candidatus Hodarchaeales archaeon]|jgi:predicted membrane protein (TIGR00267 family)
MTELSDKERKRFLNAAKKIYVHKLMQTKGYETLVKKAKDERIKQLLIQISSDEAKHAVFWLERIDELGSKREGATRVFTRNLKAGFMIRILGTKGFFEWAVLGEEEGIQDLSIQAEKIRDTTTSETWSRFASDERMHLERMKSEVLGMEAWEIRGGAGVRDLIFGANDGLVSTIAFVTGVFGAVVGAIEQSQQSQIILLSAMAELLAGTISMATGSYISSKSELEVFERESQRRKAKKGKTIEEERRELIRFYLTEGFKKEEAEAMAARIIERKELPNSMDTLEELGLAPEEIGNPLKAGILTGISFALGALVPILPFAFEAVSSVDALIASIVGTVLTLFGVGAMRTIFSRKNWFRSGLEMMAIGTSAAAVTYVIGTLFSMIVG